MADTPKESHSTPTLTERDYYTAMSHFYRGELGRIMIWRQRLDTTTNWAIISSTAITTFALGRPEISHIVFMIANAMVFLLLTIEGRRYRYYDAFRARVRILEVHFLVPIVVKFTERLEGDWRNLLAEDLMIPSFKIGIRESIGRRLLRNYTWIFVLLLVAWSMKIVIHGHVSNLEQFFEVSGRSQPLPPLLFWTIIAIFYGVLAVLAYYGRKRQYGSGEILRRAPFPERWKI
ncbi:MAG: DUF2270 domain-containing protein [Verrucomicrobiota bacterium]|nr:DUF2270 domain-containing protein [Verrucomicrobiota bacterium]